MGFRSLVLLSVVAAAFSLAPSARADVPADGGGTTTGDNLNCTIPDEMGAGHTCATCDPTGSGCGALGSDYSFVCSYSATVQVWCNGPVQNTPSDQNVASCTVAVPGGAWSGVAACGAAVAAALAMRRRRRS